uniref:Uncharacterized protein n=1 Tax=Eutreptiella gymnastica TaxID=73025 RepID=A0A7S1N227_9EUGL|mmetsp:Transcript_107627/g.185563  ORF Transcript_107627/g.185563 Transcript_107627/m.185563 type:complete len:780 (+) Transcript_107627:120-2459(+)
MEHPQEEHEQQDAAQAEVVIEAEGGRGLARFKALSKKAAKMEQDRKNEDGNNEDGNNNQGPKLAFANAVQEMMKRKDAALAETMMREELSVNKLRTRLNKLKEDLDVTMQEKREAQANVEDLRLELRNTNMTLDMTKTQLSAIRKAKGIPEPEDISQNVFFGQEKKMRDYYEKKYRQVYHELKNISQSNSKKWRPICEKVQEMNNDTRTLINSTRQVLAHSVNQMKLDIETAFTYANPEEWCQQGGCPSPHVSAEVVQDMHKHVNELTQATLALLQMVFIKDDSLGPLEDPGEITDNLNGRVQTQIAMTSKSIKALQKVKVALTKRMKEIEDEALVAAGADSETRIMELQETIAAMEAQTEADRQQIEDLKNAMAEMEGRSGGFSGTKPMCSSKSVQATVNMKSIGTATEAGKSGRGTRSLAVQTISVLEPVEDFSSFLTSVPDDRDRRASALCRDCEPQIQQAICANCNKPLECSIYVGSRPETTAAASSVKSPKSPVKSAPASPGKYSAAAEAMENMNELVQDMEEEKQELEDLGKPEAPKRNWWSKIPDEPRAVAAFEKWKQKRMEKLDHRRLLLASTVRVLQTLIVPILGRQNGTGIWKVVQQATQAEKLSSFKDQAAVTSISDMQPKLAHNAPQILSADRHQWPQADRNQYRTLSPNGRESTERTSPQLNSSFTSFPVQQGPRTLPSLKNDDLHVGWYSPKGGHRAQPPGLSRAVSGAPPRHHYGGVNSPYRQRAQPATLPSSFAAGGPDLSLSVGQIRSGFLTVHRPDLNMSI